MEKAMNPPLVELEQEISDLYFAAYCRIRNMVERVGEELISKDWGLYLKVVREKGYEERTSQTQNRHHQYCP